MKIKERNQKSVLYSVLIFNGDQPRSFRPEQLITASEIATKLMVNSKKEKTPQGEMILFGEGEFELTLTETTLLKELLQSKTDWKLGDAEAYKAFKKMFEI
jgi:hypothetical protein